MCSFQVSILVGELSSQFAIIAHQIDDPFLVGDLKYSLFCEYTHLHTSSVTELYYSEINRWCVYCWTEHFNSQFIFRFFSIKVEKSENNI